MNQRKSCPIAESMAQIQIPKEHHWNPNLESELRGGKPSHVDRVQLFHRIVVTFLRTFDRVGTGLESFLSWKCLHEQEGCSLVSIYQGQQGSYKPMQALIRLSSTLVCTYKTGIFADVEHLFINLIHFRIPGT